jgi:hypothetical protein
METHLTTAIETGGVPDNGSDRNTAWVIAFLLLCFEAVLIFWLGYSLAVRGDQPPVLQLSNANGSLAFVSCPSPSPFACEDAIHASAVRSLETQVRFWQGAPPWENLIDVTRAGKTRHIHSRTELLSSKWLDIVDEFNKLVLMSLGVFVVYRGRGRLALLGGLALYGLAAGAGIRPALMDIPAPFVVTVHVLRQALFAGGLLCLTLLSIQMLYPELPPRQRDSIAKALAALATLTAGVVFYVFLERVVLWPMYNYIHFGAQPHDQTWRRILFVTPTIAVIWPMGLMGVAVAKASRQNAELYRWIFASTFFGLVGVIVWWFYSAFRSPPQGDDLQYDTWIHALVLTQIVMGVGYGYAFVRHRLVDVAFVMNRAAMLGVIAFLVAAIVIAVDRLIDPRIPDSLSPWLYYLTVLGIALSLRFMEPPIESALDRLVFARRYRIKQGLAALRAASHMAETPEGLVRAVAEQLRTLIRARSVTLYERNGEALVPTYVDSDDSRSSLPPLEKDDAISKRIRSTLAPMEAQGLATKLPQSAVIFPMVLGDHLAGAVVVDRQSESDPYDPDLRALIGRFIRDFTGTLMYLRTVRAQ